MEIRQQEILVHNDYGSFPWVYPLLKEWARLLNCTLYHFVYTIPTIKYWDGECYLSKNGDPIIKLVDTSYVPKYWEETPFVSLHLNPELAFADKLEVTKYNRDDRCLIQAAKNLPDLMKSMDIYIVKIPLHIKWEICDYDGKEWVAEAHRKWYPC